MKAKKIFLIACAITVGGAIGLRQQLSSLVAQTAFTGVTFTQKVYYNCSPGQSGCDYGATMTNVYNANLDHVSSLSVKGDLLPAERMVDAGDRQLHVFPSVNEYFTLTLKRRPVPPPDSGGKCAAFILPGLTALEQKNVLGYKTLSYSAASGWVYDYFPDLGCVSVLESSPMAAQPGHPASTTIYVFDTITPTADRALFVPNAGMVDTLPSKALRDKAVAAMVSKGRSAQEAETAWADQLTMSSRQFDLFDSNWKKIHP